MKTFGGIIGAGSGLLVAALSAWILLQLNGNCACVPCNGPMCALGRTCYEPQCVFGMPFAAYWASIGTGLSAVFTVVGYLVGRQWEP